MEFKIVIVGDSECGKTTFVNRHLTGEFGSEPTTCGFVFQPLRFKTNYGVVVFNIWDISGSVEDGLRDQYYDGANGMLLFFDVTNKDSYMNLESWFGEVEKVTGPIPTIVCGNKVDLKDRVVKPKSITFHRKHSSLYYDISSKSNYNYEKPFLQLARLLTGHDDLVFKPLED